MVPYLLNNSGHLFKRKNKRIFFELPDNVPIGSVNIESKKNDKESVTTELLYFYS